MNIQKQEHVRNTVAGFESVIQEAQQLVDGMTKHQLNTPETHDKWGMLQCIKHLSLSAQPYLQNIEKALDKNNPNPQIKTFQSSWKGDLFTKLISPSPEGEVRRPIQTFSSMNPIEMLDMDDTLTEFVKVHTELIELVKVLGNYDLTRVRVATALGPIIKLRMGDAFRFLLGHAERHLVQLKRIKSAIT